MLIGSWPKSFRKVNNAFHRRNQSSVDTAVCFVLTYPLDSDLCGEKRYPAFEQPGPELQIGVKMPNLHFAAIYM